MFTSLARAIHADDVIKIKGRFMSVCAFSGNFDIMEWTDQLKPGEERYEA